MKFYVGASTRICMHKFWRDKRQIPWETSRAVSWENKTYMLWWSVVKKVFAHLKNVWFHRTYIGWYRSKLKLRHDFSPAMNKHALFKTEAIWISYQVLLCLSFIKPVLKKTSFNEPQALISFYDKTVITMGSLSLHYAAFKKQRKDK